MGWRDGEWGAESGAERSCAHRRAVRGHPQGLPQLGPGPLSPYAPAMLPSTSTSTLLSSPMSGTGTAYGPTRPLCDPRYSESVRAYAQAEGYAVLRQGMEVRAGRRVRAEPQVHARRVPQGRLSAYHPPTRCPLPLYWGGVG
eukprot:3020311-Rhodomonas_salina.1